MPKTLERADRSEIERRRRKAALLKKSRERRAASVAPLELRESDDGTLTLVGIACRTGVEYDVGWYREIVLPGALRRTLSEDPDVQLVINHAAGGQLPLARTTSGTMTLEEVDEGLQVSADLDPEDPDVQSLVRKMKRGDVDGMSFAFMVTDDIWSDDMSLRTIRSLSLHRGDVSVVNQGANPHAYATVRSEAAAALAARSRAEIFDALFEVRAGKKLSAATTEILTQVLSLTEDAETSAGDARALLDGLVNPDDGDDSVERSIDNEKGLCAAIRAVNREPGKDERRAELISRARALELPGMIPDGWAATGALAEGRALDSQEQRETYQDTLAALQGAVEDKFCENGDYWYAWVQDFTDTDVIFYAGGDLWSAPYTLIPGGAVTVGDAVGVRPVTEYVQTGETEADEPAEVEMLSAPLPDSTVRARQVLRMREIRGAR